MAGNKLAKASGDCVMEFSDSPVYRKSPATACSITVPLTTGTLHSQSTLRRPEVHRLYVHFNVSSPFVLHVWEIMICITCGQSQKFSLKTKGYNF